ncbi:MAG: mechanosensitive ion channel [Armatimonadetes bacterium]|nr:mechanosensitive ion channel [Armatimonadota bacterium]
MQSFGQFFSELWLSQFPNKLAQAICVAAVFEVLVWAINRRIRASLRPALARDRRPDPALRAHRMKLLLRPPMAVNRTVMYTAAAAMILRIFGLPIRLELMPIAGAAVAAALIATWPVIHDAVRGYLLLYQFAFAEGEEVTVGQLRGTVAAIGLTTTILVTADGTQAVIANGTIRQLINHSRATKTSANSGMQSTDSPQSG